MVCLYTTIQQTTPHHTNHHHHQRKPFFSLSHGLTVSGQAPRLCRAAMLPRCVSLRGAPTVSTPCLHHIVWRLSGQLNPRGHRIQTAVGPSSIAHPRPFQMSPLSGRSLLVGNRAVASTTIDQTLVFVILMLCTCRMHAARCERDPA